MIFRDGRIHRVDITERLLPAPSASLVKHHVEEDPPCPGIRSLVKPNLPPVTPRTLEHPLSKVLSSVKIADQEVGLPNEAVALRAHEDVKFVIALLRAQRSPFRFPLLLDTPEVARELQRVSTFPALRDQLG
jgi:hypothetical protein